MTESYDTIPEKFNGILKQKFLQDYQVDIETTKLIVKDAVRIYNTKRPHWSCHMKTPQEIHQQNNLEIRTYKKSESSKATLATLR